MEVNVLTGTACQQSLTNPWSTANNAPDGMGVPPHRMDCNDVGADPVPLSCAGAR